MDSLEVNGQIVLEKVKYSHAFQVFQAIDQNREFLSDWLPFAAQTVVQEDTEAFIRSVLAVPEDKGEYVFVIWYRTNLAGLISLKDTDLLNQRTEIGYWLIKKMTGKGIMTNAVRTLVDFAFMTMKMNRVQIKCAVGNSRSAAIPKRLGFYFEGVERAGEKYDDRFFDLEVYSLLKKEWVIK